jgi:DNA modification methylase
MTQPNRMPIPGLKPKDLVGIPWRVAFALQADGWWLRADIVWAKPNPMPESVQDRPTKAHEYVFLLSKSEHYHYDAAAIRERQVAPEASTPDDAARAFSRRRAAAADPTQGMLTADAIAARRRTSGNKARKYRQDHGGPTDSASHQVHAIPWTDQDGLRNKRSVWTVATEPYGGAHFATFPQKLIEPCILAGCPAGGVVLDPFGGSGTVGEASERLGRQWILLEINPEYAELARARTAQRGLFVAPAPPAETGAA